MITFCRIDGDDVFAVDSVKGLVLSAGKIEDAHLFHPLVGYLAAQGPRSYDARDVALQMIHDHSNCKFHWFFAATFNQLAGFGQLEDPFFCAPVDTFLETQSRFWVRQVIGMQILPLKSSRTVNKLLVKILNFKDLLYLIEELDGLFQLDTATVADVSVEKNVIDTAVGGGALQPSPHQRVEAIRAISTCFV